MAAEWLHCNQCFLKYNTGEKFFITECGHINCKTCASVVAQNKNVCLVCKTTTKVIALTKDVDNAILAYFQDPADQLAEFVKVLRFQSKNQKSLIKAILAKYNFAKRENCKCYKVMDEMRTEIKRLKNENNILKGSANAMHTTHPFHSQQSLFTSTPQPPVSHSEAQGSLQNLTMSSIHSGSTNQHRNFGMMSGMRHDPFRRFINGNGSSYNTTYSPQTVPVHSKLSMTNSTMGTIPFSQSSINSFGRKR